MVKITQARFKIKFKIAGRQVRFFEVISSTHQTSLAVALVPKVEIVLADMYFLRIRVRRSR